MVSRRRRRRREVKMGLIVVVVCVFYLHIGVLRRGVCRATRQRDY